MKHRYVFLRGTKAEKKTMFNEIKDRIKPYPKFDVKRPDMGELDEIKAEIGKQGFEQINIFDFLSNS